MNLPYQAPARPYQRRYVVLAGLVVLVVLGTTHTFGGADTPSSSSSSSSSAAAAAAAAAAAITSGTMRGGEGKQKCPPQRTCPRCDSATSSDGGGRGEEDGSGGAGGGRERRSYDEEEGSGSGGSGGGAAEGAGARCTPAPALPCIPLDREAVEVVFPQEPAPDSSTAATAAAAAAAAAAASGTGAVPPSDLIAGVKTQKPPSSLVSTADKAAAGGATRRSDADAGPSSSSGASPSASASSLTEDEGAGAGGGESASSMISSHHGLPARARVEGSLRVHRRPPRLPPAHLLDPGLECDDESEHGDTDVLLADAPTFLQGEAGSPSGGGSGGGGRGKQAGGRGPLPPPWWSATNIAYEEHTGETLLGECSCPLRSPAPAGWSFDCGDYDWRILSELAPWHGVNVTHEMLDTAFSLATGNVPPGYHFSVHKGRVYYRSQPPMSAYHEQLLDFLRTVSEMVPLPDAEFIMHPWDHAKVWRQDPVPVFAFIRDSSKTDVTIPYVYKWNPHSHDFGWDLHGDCRPWEEREAKKVTWRGGCTGPASGYQAPLWPLYLRYRATQLTREHPDVLDAGLSEGCVDAARAGAPLPSLDLVGGACHYRHLLLVDGNTASGRSSSWFHSGATILKPDSVFSEWYYHLLRPWVHYVPVREYLEDLPEQARFVTEHPKAAQCIARNAARMAAKHLNREAAACYMWRLLTEWARHQQVEGSRTSGFVPI